MCKEGSVERQGKPIGVAKAGSGIFRFLGSIVSRSLSPLGFNGFRLIFVNQNIQRFVVLVVINLCYFFSIRISFIEFSYISLPTLFISFNIK